MGFPVSHMTPEKLFLCSTFISSFIFVSEVDPNSSELSAAFELLQPHLDGQV